VTGVACSADITAEPQLEVQGKASERPTASARRYFAEALKAAKRALDPHGLLNPGVLIDA
jgi:FAD/FMN-containing dehydrogenase